MTPTSTLSPSVSAASKPYKANLNASKKCAFCNQWRLLAEFRKSEFVGRASPGRFSCYCHACRSKAKYRKKMAVNKAFEARNSTQRRWYWRVRKQLLKERREQEKRPHGLAGLARHRRPHPSGYFLDKLTPEQEKRYLELFNSYLAKHHARASVDGRYCGLLKAKAVQAALYPMTRERWLHVTHKRKARRAARTRALKQQVKAGLTPTESAKLFGP